jgi:hypothetical protein
MGTSSIWRVWADCDAANVMDPISRAIVANNAEATHKRPGGVTGKGWVPGRSGNPSGRPKKKPITEIFEELLEDPKTREGIKKQVRETMTSRGMAGVLLLKEAAERTEGKISQEIELNATIASLSDEEIAAKLAALEAVK